ncbi:acyl carrier protein [Paenibacillus chitinolyticus]|uniref:Acyl carrier protein n=1 Tax=Paenibacillus chitinolyticus TaxID=79263 RepID=A0A410WXH4_9BACL|nr:acyl carrier protein [Paenibacillus chitinolyticus]MCY9589762.1 acyl carrier protein [Paenibacillus chitinolyticus]MCY9598237.1 acyl carrier protein [Paenibacillus chitinolyticus]QAV19139.1 acyl carrier protein [Paenibacillus chitinolyticus]
MTKEDVYAKFVEHIKKTNQVEELQIDENDNLLEHGYIDSLSMVDMIVFLEEQVGREIVIEDYDIRKFYTLKSIYETFFQDHLVSSN